MSKRRVLFISIGFYDYDRAIVEEFESLGYEVDYYSEVPTDIKYRFFKRINNRRGIQRMEEGVSRKIALSCGCNYDIVFVIKCEFLTREAIDMIKTKSPNSRWILYLWDSIRRVPASMNNFDAFDKVYSFDRVDCIENRAMIFNPLFFRKEYDMGITNEGTYSWDLFFLGWYHSDRFRLVSKIISYCERQQLKAEILLYTGYFNYLVQRFLRLELKGQRRFLIFKPVSADSNLGFIKRSKTILDIAHPKQSGLTMRTIELLGARRKIITTNSDIVHYDFYHPDNVLIIDRENPVLQLDFFKSEYAPIPDSIRDQYKISNWLRRMI